MSIDLMRSGFLCLLAVVSGILVTVSFPPYDLAMLAWVGLAPFLAAVRRGSTGCSVWVSFLFGCVFGALALQWSAYFLSLQNRLIVIFLQSMYFLAFGLLYRLQSRSLGAWTIVSAPALWVALEYARANLFFLAWPWNLLGHSQYRFLPIIQVAEVPACTAFRFCS
ncbi:MAG: hypothetical protein AB9873_16535 [Syntrophobacteraceae bacterium]